MFRRALVTVLLVASPLFARIVSVSNTPGTPSALSELAADGDQVILLWREGEREIRMRRSADRGVTFGDGPSGRMVALAARGESIFALRSAARGERVAILFTSGPTPALAKVSVMVSTDGGTTFQPPTRFDRSGGSPNADMAIDAAGRLHVVMEDRGATDRILYLLSEDGRSFSEKELSTAPGTEPRIAAWRNRLAVVWTDASSDILFTTSNDVGASFSWPVNVSRSEARSSSPQIAAEDSIHIVWNEAGSLGHARSSDLGTSFTEAVKLAEAADPSSRIAVAGSATRVTWTSNGRSYLRRSSDDGASFANIVELTSGIDGESFGGVAIIPSSFDTIAWPHTKTRAPRDAEILLIEAASALACGTSWKDPVNGNWNEAAKWSNGVPVAGSNACITVDGTYTVNVTASHAAATLQVGNPTNLLGQPTLVVQSTLTVSGELVNDGFVRLDHPTTGTATLLASPLTNNNNFEVSPGNALINGTGIVNDGVYFIKGIQTMNDTGMTFTNRGTFTIEAGAEIRPRHNFRFHQNAGVFRSLGLPLNISSSTVDADIFFFNGGNVEGTVLITGRGGFAFGPDATGTIDFEVHTGGPSIWYSGNSHPGQTIRMISRNVSSTLEIWSNVTNGGLIRMDSLAGSTQPVEFLVAQGATTLTNTGRIEVGNTALGSNKTFRVPTIVNTSTGVIDVRDDLAIAGTDNILTNSGSFTSAVGTAITPGLRSVFNQNAGTMSVGGSFTVNSHFQGPCTFNFTGGDIDGEISIIGTARLNLAAAAGSGRFLFTNGGFSSQGLLSGPIGPNQEIIIRALGTTDRQVDFASNVVNNGVIRLESAAAATASTELNIPAGTLINNNRIELASDAIADGNTRRTIRGNVTNHGQIVIGDHASLTGTNNVITNDAGITIEAGMAARLGNGTTIHQNAGTINILGTLWLEGPPRQGADVLNYNGGNVNGETYVVGSSGLNIGPNAGGSGVFYFRSTEGLEGRTPSLAGNVVAGQTIILRGDLAGPAGIVMNGNVTNGGVILFDNVGTSGKGAGITLAGDAVLTNIGTIHATASAPAAGKSISGHVTNHGSIELHDDFTFGGTNRTLTNHGAFNVFAGDVTLGAGTLVIQQAGTMRVDGRFLLQQGGNQGPDWLNFNGGQVTGAGEVLLTEACQLNIGAGAVGAGRFVFGAGSGVLTGNIAAAQTVLLRGANVTAANGFINGGTLMLENAATLNVTAGSLTNRGTLTIGGADLATTKTLNLVLNNEGRFEVLDTLSLNRVSVGHTNSAMVHVAPGQILTVAGSSTWTNPGGAFEGGGQFTVANLASFTGFGALGVNVRNEGRMEVNGTLGVSGTYTQTSTGRLDLTAGVDQVNAGGIATLAGTLNAAIVPNTCPAGDYPILTYASLVGDFATKNLNAGPGRTFTTVPGATSYLLHTNGPPCNTPTVAGNDAYTTETVLNVPAPGVLGNDVDAEGDALTARLVDAPLHGTVVLNANGSFTYTPGPTYVPTDFFTYKANDGTVDSNTATVTITIPDTLAPVTTATASPQPNQNGWNKEDVTVTLTATDTASGVKELHYQLLGVRQLAAAMSQGSLLPQSTTEVIQGASATFTLTTEGIHTIEYFAIDNAGNTEPAQTVVVKIDKTAPVATAAMDTPNANNWFKTNVPVTFTATDTVSGVSGPSTVETLVTIEGANQQIEHTFTDLAGNTATTSVTINLDKTPPTVVSTRTPAPNANGWNNTDVTAHFTASDGLSGMDGATSADVVITTEGANQEANATFTDRAGNSAAGTVSNINIDKTAPTAQAATTGEPNANGWFNGDVTVRFEGTDDLSGIDGSATVDVIVSSEGANQEIARTFTDRAGNTAAAAVSLSIDKTPPSVGSSRTPDANANGWNNSDITAHFTATDTLSGMDGAASAEVAISSEGANQEATATFTDRAGNSAAGTVNNINIDKTAPTVTAPAAVTQTTGAGASICAVAISDATLGTAAVTDNLTATTITRTGIPDGNLFPIASTTTTYTATDLAGNSATATQLVTVVDNTVPAVQAPPNVTRSTDANSCTAFISNADLGSATATDNCAGVTVTRSGVPANNLFSAGTHTITYTATDAAGNISTATQMIVVTDTAAPTITCAAKITTNASAGSCAAVVTVAPPAASDSCSTATVNGTRSDGAPLNAPYPVGTTTIQWVATDSSGNSASCTQTITVVDAQDPIITGASATPATLPADGATHDVTVNYTTSDNCGVASAVLTVTSGDAVVVNPHLVRLRGEGTVYTITITATDIHGNTSSTDVTVVVSAVPNGPCAILRQAEQQLLALMAVSNSKAVDKLEDALEKLRRAIVKCAQVPPDRQGVLGELEGAAGDLEAAIKDRLITSAQGTPILQLMTTAARFFTMQAIDEAIARGGNKGQITAAQSQLKVGDDFVVKGRYKDAISKFRDALSKAESA